MQSTLSNLNLNFSFCICGFFHFLLLNCPYFRLLSLLCLCTVPVPIYSTCARGNLCAHMCIFRSALKIIFYSFSAFKFTNSAFIVLNFLSFLRLTLLSFPLCPDWMLTVFIFLHSCEQDMHWMLKMYLSPHSATWQLFLFYYFWCYCEQNSLLNFIFRLFTANV